MTFNNKIHINNLYLDTHPDIIYVIPENEDFQGKTGYELYRDRTDTYKFVTKITEHLEYTSVTYEKVFYEQLQRLLVRIRSNPDYTFIIAKLGYGSFFNFLKPKLYVSLKELTNVICLWENTNETTTIEFWGFKNIFGKIDLFDKSDVCVPFKTPYAKEYFTIQAKNKFEARKKLNAKNKFT